VVATLPLLVGDLYTMVGILVVIILPRAAKPTLDIFCLRTCSLQYGIYFSVDNAKFMTLAL